VMRYSLAPQAVGARAWALAVWGAVRSAVPAWLVVALVTQLGLAPRAWMTLAACLVALLAVARGFAEHRASRLRLAAFAIDADEDGLTVRTARGETRLARAAIARVTDIAGPLGGLRLDLVGATDLPSRVDVPHGGDAYGELREHLAAWVPVGRARRRGRVARAAVASAIVAGVFFVPFVLSDARGSRMAVALVLVAAWSAMRLVLAR